MGTTEKKLDVGGEEQEKNQERGEVESGVAGHLDALAVLAVLAVVPFSPLWRCLIGCWTSSFHGIGHLSRCCACVLCKASVQMDGPMQLGFGSG